MLIDEYISSIDSAYTDAEKQWDDVNMTLANSFMQSCTFPCPSVNVTAGVQ